MTPRILIVSPIPSHPQDQGNAARIHQIGRMLQHAGCLVHFLYYQMEGLTAAQAAAMAGCWDGFHPMPTIAHDMAPTGPGHYRIDDWCPAEIGAAAQALNRRFRFAAVIVNYVWFSRVLEALQPVGPGGLLKLIDTHDIFGDRHHRFAQAGLPPEWFFTSPEEELRGLRRAELVLAIQPQEAAYFRGLGHAGVLTIGHLPALSALAPRPSPDGRLRLGILASGNPINLAAFERLRAALPRPGIPGTTLLLAGSICGKVADPAPFRPLGRLETLDEFYETVDGVINPMHFGTGLAIKSVEALARARPIIATTRAMTGLPKRHPLHGLASPEAIGAALTAGRIDAAMLAELAAESRHVIAAYLAQSAPDLHRLLQALGAG